MVAIILVLLFLAGTIYVRGSFIAMMANVYKLIRYGAQSGIQSSKIFSPSFFVFIISLLLFSTIVLASVYPRSGNIFYQAYLNIMPQKETRGSEVNEGFLLEVPYDPNTREQVITKQELLQRGNPK